VVFEGLDGASADELSLLTVVLGQLAPGLLSALRSLTVAPGGSEAELRCTIGSVSLSGPYKTLGVGALLEALGACAAWAWVAPRLSEHSYSEPHVEAARGAGLAEVADVARSQLVTAWRKMLDDAKTSNHFVQYHQGFVVPLGARSLTEDVMTTTGAVLGDPDRFAFYRSTKDAADARLDLLAEARLISKEQVGRARCKTFSADFELSLAIAGNAFATPVWVNGKQVAKLPPTNEAGYQLYSVGLTRAAVSLWTRGNRLVIVTKDDQGDWDDMQLLGVMLRGQGGSGLQDTGPPVCLGDAGCSGDPNCGTGFYQLPTGQSYVRTFDLLMDPKEASKP
jgi:hypothetical protein